MGLFSRLNKRNKNSLVRLSNSDLITHSELSKLVGRKNYEYLGPSQMSLPIKKPQQSSEFYAVDSWFHICSTLIPQPLSFGCLSGEEKEYVKELKNNRIESQDFDKFTLPFSLINAFLFVHDIYFRMANCEIKSSKYFLEGEAYIGKKKLQESY